MSTYDDLVKAHPDIYDFFSFDEERGSDPRFGPNFFSSAGMMDEGYRYSPSVYDPVLDEYHDYDNIFHQESITGFGYIVPSDETFNWNGMEVDHSGSIGTSWTYEFLFRIDDTERNVHLLAYSDWSTSDGFVITHDVVQGLLLYVTDYATPVLVHGEFLADGGYHHIVLTYDGAILKLYLDNLLIYSASSTMSIAGLSGAVTQVGFSEFEDNGEASFSGMLDALAIYSSVLSSGDIAAHYGEIFGAVEVIDHNNIPLSFWRAGNAILDFIGDGQFERWRGGISPVLGLSEKANKIQVYTDGYIFDTVPIKEVTADAIITDIHFNEITSDGYVFADTIVYADAIVKGTNKRLYPRDSTSRTEQIVNRNYPLEP